MTRLLTKQRKRVADARWRTITNTLNATSNMPDAVSKAFEITCGLGGGRMSGCRRRATLLPLCQRLLAHHSTPHPRRLHLGPNPHFILDQNTLCSRDAAPHNRLVATVSETPVNLLAA
jgi:hypothetical protein